MNSAPNIICVIKSRRMRQAGHMAHMGENMVHIGFRWGNQRIRDHLEHHGTDERKILEGILKDFVS
jgi:hypothetical protein